MRKACPRVIMSLAILSLLGGAGAEAKGQYSRRNAIVEAVQKTRASIVSVKVEKKGSWGRKEIGGTGVIVDERGFVVTNRHVIASADRVTVHLYDGTELAAEVLVEDARHDLAVLRLPAGRRLPALAFAPSNDVMVGETVVAVGHPFGYQNSVSSGIVAAVGREVTMPTGEVLRDLIQVTAGINPGNSGGPLLNVNGELIGINVALREGAQGIAFALSADSVKDALSKHLSSARLAGVSHGLSVTERTVEADGPGRQRVVVQDVVGGAADGGPRRGDEVIRVGERPVFNRLDVERAVWDRKAGDKVAVTVLRDGREVAVGLTLSAAKAGTVVAARKPEPARGTPAPASAARMEAPRIRKP